MIIIIILTIKCRIMRYTERVARVGFMGCKRIFWLEKPKRKRKLNRPTHRHEFNIKMYLK
jgi:hypothetical protein